MRRRAITDWFIADVPRTSVCIGNDNADRVTAMGEILDRLLLAVSWPRLDETKEIDGSLLSLEARAGIEPTYKDLQSSA